MKVRLLANTPDNVQVDLPSGKISKSGERKRLRKQNGMTCALSAIRRISFFNTTDKNNQSVLAYKKIKKALQTDKARDFNHLINLALNILKDHGIEIKKALSSSKSFVKRCEEFRTGQKTNLSELLIFALLKPAQKWFVLYDLLFEHIFKPLLNVQDADWHPRDGIAGLKKCLEKHGAIFFSGKFGPWCYVPGNQTQSLSESKDNRHVYFFNEASYLGDIAPFTHCIIVDQVKTINDVDMVFFRDPYFSSRPNAAETVFMIPYDTFVSRLTDKQLNRYAHGECAEQVAFGLTSSCPEKLYLSSNSPKI